MKDYWSKMKEISKNIWKRKKEYMKIYEKKSERNIDVKFKAVDKKSSKNWRWIKGTNEKLKEEQRKKENRLKSK